MCGLIFVRRKNNKAAADIVAEAYQIQKSRGSEGFGYIALTDGVARVERDTTETGIMRKLRQERSSEIMFHHRRPTSTENYIFATHPIIVSNPMLQYDYMFIHNGVISDSDTARRRHENLGFEYNTYHEYYNTTEHNGKVYSGTKYYKFNDSEALAVELALFEEDHISEINVAGTIAFMGYQLEKGTNRVVKRMWGHNTGNPLYKAIIQKKRGTYEIMKSDKIGVEVETGVYHWINYNTPEQVHHFTIDIGSTNKTYHYTQSMGYHRPAALPPSNVVVHLPTPEDFDDSFQDVENAAILSQIKELDVKIGDLEGELACWQSDLMSSNSMSERRAYQDEIRTLKLKIDRLESQKSELEEEFFDAVQESYGNIIEA